MLTEEELDDLTHKIAKLIKKKSGQSVDLYDLNDALGVLLADLGVEVIDEAA